MLSVATWKPAVKKRPERIRKFIQIEKELSEKWKESLVLFGELGKEGGVVLQVIRS